MGASINWLNVVASSEPDEFRMFVSAMLDRASAIGEKGADSVTVKADTLDAIVSEIDSP